MKKINVIYILVLVITSCTSTSKSDSEFLIVNIEEGLNNFQISNLSDYASSIDYVRLETHDDCLVLNKINNIFIEDNKIFVHDSEPYLKVFDAETGKYLYNIGSKGQGPGELPNMYSVDINPDNKIILLCWGEFIHRFDFDGNFLGKIKIPSTDDNEWISAPIVTLDDYNYAGIVVHYGEEQKSLAILFNTKQEIIGSLKCYENPIQPPNLGGGIVWSPFSQGGLFYRCESEIRYYRGFSDTVYTFNKERTTFNPYFIIDYGKHKSTLNFTRYAENPDLIKVSSIRENEGNVFLNFTTMKASPEPFEDEIFRGGVWSKFTNHSIIGVLNKKNESFHFLNQPILGIPGIKNDIDGGISFWVRNVSSNGELIDFHHAYKFLEYAEALPDASDSFNEIVSQISEYDNPIVIISK